MCGIIGIIGTQESALEAYKGLLNLQHRGQDAAGLASYNQSDHSFFLKKRKGLAGEVFEDLNWEELKGQMAIAHNRYATVGGASQKDLQPINVPFPLGLTLVHNGNLVNYHELIEDLKKHHYLNQTTNDGEAILGLLTVELAKSIQGEHTLSDLVSPTIFFKAIQNVVEKTIGGFSSIIMVPGHGLLAFRDPWGLRPLLLGRKKSASPSFSYSYALTSETVALNYLEYEILRDIRPGEILFIDCKGEMFSHQMPTPKKSTPCMFEWVYFSTPESKWENQEMYAVRYKLGIQLAQIVRNKNFYQSDPPDIIVPIPDSSRPSAMALSEELNIPYREVLIKNRYIQRSFILNTQEKREKAVELKLSPIRSEIQGKNLLLVDDSIVRGTTSKFIIKMLRKMGAKKIYFSSACPPIRFPCYYGVDFPDQTELVANDRDESSIADCLGVDDIVYMNEERLQQSIGLSDLCMACLNGKYPTDVKAAEHFREMRKKQRKT